MSAQSAILALVLVGSGSVLCSRAGKRASLQILALIAVILTEFFLLVAIESYAAGNPPFTSPEWLTVPAWFIFTSAIAGAALLASPHSISRLRVWFFGVEAAGENPVVTREEKQALAILFSVGLAAFAGGIAYLRLDTRTQQNEVIAALRTLSDLKLKQIEQWRLERFADMDTMTRMPSVAEILRSEFTGANDPRLDELGNWARAFVRGYGYAGLVLFDPQMRPIFAYPKMPDLKHPALLGQLATPPAEAKPVELKPYVDGAGALRLDFLIPLRPYKQEELAGVVLLQTDPARFLFPILESWPAEYASGQTTLWLREGDTMISLGGMRPAPGVTADEIRPLGSTRALAGLDPKAMGRLVFGSTIVTGEGPDRRGVPIIGVGGPVPGSPWAFSTRLDSRDAYAQVRRNAIVIAGLTAGLFIGTGVATGRLSRQRQRTLRDERVDAELAQKRSAARLGMVMRHANDMILVTDENRRVVEANQRAMDTYGWTKEEFLRLTTKDLRAPEALDSLAADARLADVPEGAIYETKHRRKDGTTFPVEISVRLVELDGQRQRLSIIRDITERRLAEATLRASEERYRLIADNTSDVIWLYDQVADRFTYASPSTLPLLGYRPEEIVGRTLLSLVAPASQDAARLALERAVRSATGTRAPVHLAVELEQRRKDGGLVPTEVVVSVLSDGSGRVTHILGVTRDITERKRAHDALEKFNTQLERQVETRTAELAARNREIEALVDSIPDTVLLCDGRGELVTSHFAQNRESSFPFANGGGGSGLSSQHPVLLEIARELHTVAWAGQEAIMLEFDRNINGVDYSIEARATPAGEDRLLILLRDISARRRGERVAQANLERERQLSEMKTQFISVASHEFRTPLAAATGSLELLERHAARITEAKRLELLGRAQRSLGRLTTIMDNVLQLSRAESGRAKVKRMNIDLVQFVQDLIREVEMGDRQQHTFAFQPSGGGTPVPIDTNLFNHILSNLLGNAVRYSPAGTRISVTLDIGGQAFSLTVADEGIGIPEAERDRVFEPFARGSNVGQISGTGLGLNIVKRYTELMGGRIELLSTARGATFRVSIPLIQPTA